MTDIDRQALRDFMATEVMRYPIYEPVYGKSCPYKPPYFARIMRKLVLWPLGRIDGIDWHPDLDSNQLDMLVDMLVKDGLEIEIYLSPGDPAEVEICDPKLRNVRCYETGDDRIALERHPDRRLAVLLAIKAAKEAK